MKCPECDGVGGFEYWDEKMNPFAFVECDKCNGTGEIPDESQVYGNDCRDGRCEM